MVRQMYRGKDLYIFIKRSETQNKWAIFKFEFSLQSQSRKTQYKGVFNFQYFRVISSESM